MEVMDIRLGNFQYLNLATTVKSNGQLGLSPQNMASVSAVIAGRVKNINVLEGNYVKKGQALAQIENQEVIEMQQDYMTGINQLSVLEKNYNRIVLPQLSV